MSSDISPDLSPESGPRAGRKEWTGLAVLALPTLLLSLDMSVLYLALPHLSADLRPDGTQTLWIIDGYGFMIAGFLVTMGTLGDRVGRRRLLLIGAAAFGLASVAAAYSTSPETLIACRALLGVSGATLMPSTLSLISVMFRDPAQRTAAIGLWMTCFIVGMTIGPLIGGLLLEWFWWGSAFLLGVPVMALLLVAGPLLLPEYRDPGAGRLDLTSVFLSLAAVLPIVYGLKQIAKTGFTAQPIAAIVIGLVFCHVFARRQRTLADPLLDLGLFRNGSFRSALAIMLLGTVASGGTLLFVTQHLQLVNGLSPLGAGLWMLPPALGFIAGSTLAPRLVRRMSPAAVVGLGLLVSAAGYLMLVLVDGASDLAVLIAGYTVSLTGVGPMMVLGTDLVVGSAPPEQAGSASAVSETGNELGIALGVALLGSVGTAVYRGQVAGAVPADAAVRDSLAVAVAEADRLPAGLLDAAREAFSSALNAVTAVSAVLALGLAVLAMTTLRRTGAVEPQEEPAPAPCAAGEEAAR